MTTLDSILIGLAPVLLIGVIGAIWRFGNSLRDNTRAIQELQKEVRKMDGLESRLTGLENWRDLVSAQALGKQLRGD